MLVLAGPGCDETSGLVRVIQVDLFNLEFC